MDRLTILGLLLGIGALFGTQLLEGGHLGALVQGPAAMIVLVGTLGATLLSTSREVISSARVELALAFRVLPDRRHVLPAKFRDLAFLARKDGLISLEKMSHTLPSAFMQRAIQHVIDGCDESQLRDVLEADIESRSNARLEAARVFEVAGGYAPTMGILGAVLGLVRAMEALADPDALGQGIAVAFIATIYGVGLANLVLLPLAEKIRDRADREQAEDEMVADGMLGLQAGVAPRMIERQLQARLTHRSNDS